MQKLWKNVGGWVWVHLLHALRRMRRKSGKGTRCFSSVSKTKRKRRRFLRFIFFREGRGKVINNEKFLNAVIHHEEREGWTVTTSFNSKIEMEIIKCQRSRQMKYIVVKPHGHLLKKEIEKLRKLGKQMNAHVLRVLRIDSELAYRRIYILFLG